MLHPSLHLTRVVASGVLLLAAGIAARAAELVVELQNGPYERFREPVQTRLTPAQAESVRGQSLIESGPDGVAVGPVAFALDASDPAQVVLAWIPTGILAPGETRRYAFATPAKQAEAPESTDLQVTVTPTRITVANTFFEIRHPTKGQGGFPDRFVFRFSGRAETQIVFLDRLFSRGLGQFSLHDDAAATASVLFQSPVRVVVETRAGYHGAGYAPGNPRAVYRYVYSANSPVVEVSAVITRDDEQLWNELHFMHPTRSGLFYTKFITGEPFLEIPMLAVGSKSKAYHGQHWALLATDDDALGVGIGGGDCWDAANEFVYYVAATRPSWQTKRQEFAAGLYVGPAVADPAWYSRWLGPQRSPQVRVLAGGVQTAAPAATAAPLTGAYALANDALRLVFADSAAGFDCLGIENRLAGNTRFVTTRPDAPGLWQLEFRGPAVPKPAEGKKAIDEEKVSLTNRDAAVRSAQLAGKPGEKQTLTLVWKGLNLPGEAAAVDVTATVTLDAGRAASEWRLEVANRSQRLGLWEVRYPVLATVCAKGTADVLLPGGNWGGRLLRKSKSSCDASYPSGGCPMQFMAFNLGEAGLYLGAHDDGARPKRLVISGEQDATFATFAENMGVPGSSVAAPFPVVVAAYTGDWWNAARLYREWATHQAWTKKGLIQERKDIPKHFTELGFWMLGGGDPVKEVKPFMLEAEKRFPAPVGLHWYCWHEIPFDNSYPEYFPTKPQVPEVVHELVKRGQVMMPYINGRLWDRDIPSFAALGVKGAAKQRSGEVYIEVYGSGRFLAPMCPATQIWQDKVNEVVGRLINEVGVNAIYLDQIGAAHSALCFDPAHGHPLGGGRHWVDGYRVLLDRVKAQAVKGNVALTTENTAEPYMDNIDGFLAWNPRFETDVPALPAVYSGYTIYFTSPEEVNDDLDAFVAAQGRDFLWGCQLGWNGTWILDAKHREHAEYQKRLCEYRLAAKEFLVYGQLLGEVKPLNPVPTVTVTWNRSNAHAATLPAVMATLWCHPHNLASTAVLMANVSGEPQEFSWVPEAGALVAQIPRSGLATVLWRLAPEGMTPWRVLSRREHTEVLAAREVRAVRVVATGGEELAGLAAQARKTAESGKASPDLRTAAGEFLFDLAMREERIHVTPPLPLATVARGEPAEAVLAATNGGKNARELRLSWADGRTETLTIPAKGKAGGGKAEARYVFWPVETQPGLADGSVNVTLGEGKSAVTRRFPVYIKLVPPVSVAMAGVSRVRSGESFLLPIEARNHSKAARSGRIELRVPNAWRVEPPPVLDLGQLAPGGRRTFLLKCTVPPATQETTQTIEARYVEQAAASRVSVLKSRPVAECVFLVKPPVIDGKLDEWTGAPVIVLGGERRETVKIDKDYGGAADCSAKVWVGWDAAQLYLAAEVQDNAFFQDTGEFELWRGDCIQLAFRNGPPNKDPEYDGTEFEIGLTKAPAGPVMFQWMPGRCPLKEGRLAVVREGSVTRYEAAIPWAAAGLRTPQPGHRLAWSLTVNDNDGQGFRGWLEWTPGFCGGKDSSQFGWLRFVR